MDPKRAVRRARAAAERPELLRKIRARERREEREETPLTQEQKQQQTEHARALRGKARILRNIAPENQTTEKIWAIAASAHIALVTLAFYPLQFFLWVISLAALGAETVLIVDFFFPGKEIYMFTYLAIAFLGICSMLFGVLIYTLRGVQCFSGIRGLWFAICVTGYLLIFLNFVPWVAIWMLGIIYMAGKTQENEEEQS